MVAAAALQRVVVVLRERECWESSRSGCPRLTHDVLVRRYGTSCCPTKTPPSLRTPRYLLPAPDSTLLAITFEPLGRFHCSRRGSQLAPRASWVGCEARGRGLHHQGSGPPTSGREFRVTPVCIPPPRTRAPTPVWMHGLPSQARHGITPATVCILPPCLARLGIDRLSFTHFSELKTPGCVPGIL